MEISKHINENKLNLVVNDDVPSFVKGLEEMIRIFGNYQGM